MRGLPRGFGRAVGSFVFGLLLALVVSLSVADYLITRDTLLIETAVPLRPVAGNVAELAHPRRVTMRIPDTAEALGSLYATLNYRLGDIRSREDLPRIYVTALPVDLADTLSVDERKSIFLRTVLPLVALENQRLRANRRRLLELREALASGVELTGADRYWLDRQRSQYGVGRDEWERLLRRLDVVPPSLALAQAATESAWGTSRFVQQGNALFGLWTWSDEVPGLVPLEREEGARHRVRAFGTLAASVRAYMHTLNTHWAYADFRARRAAHRKAGRYPDGLDLAKHVGQYSTERNRYTAGLRLLIRANELNRLDRAMLVGNLDASAVAAAGESGLVQGVGR